MKRIYRSQDDRIIAGVCSGFADYFQLDSTLIRVVWIFFTLFGGSGILGYILASVILPDEGVQIKSKPPSTTKNKKSHFWEIILLIVGIIVILQHDYLFRTILYSFWGTSLNAIFSLGLVIIGVILLFQKRKDLMAFFAKEDALPLHASETDKKIAGICGGIGESVNVDANIIRLIWVFGTFMTAGTGLLIYIALAIILPKRTYSEVEE